MIRLGTVVDPPWFDLPRGIRVQLKPFDPAGDIAAQRAIAIALRDGATADEAEAAGFMVTAQRRIAAWEGVAADDGEPAPCTPENIALVMREVPGLLAHFREHYLLWSAAWGAEGNASATSPTGTSARDQPTAAAA